MDHHLAQINIGKFRRPIADPVNAEFIASLDRVNALADRAPGFVWRLKGAGNNAIDLQPFADPDMAVNMSVWTDLEALAGFVYRAPGHREIMRRRREWFEPMTAFIALWWIPAGHLPSIDEGMTRIRLIERQGPSAEAFLFRHPFPPPGAAALAPVLEACA